MRHPQNDEYRRFTAKKTTGKRRYFLHKNVMCQIGDFLEEVICKGWKPLKILIS